ncbi:MAG TPA: hypothetical protein VH518_22225, partial [Tepidisphaeraceae bacterium]
RFVQFDIECVDVLIGKPDTAEAGGKIETLLEQLRQRQLSKEQIETYEHQRLASDEQRKLNEAQARAAKQAELTGSQVQIQIAQNQGDADLARARKAAEQTVVTAEAAAKEREFAGRGEGLRIAQTGEAETSVLAKKVAALGDPKLYAAALIAEHLSRSTQPLVPQRLFVTQPGESGSSSQGLLGLLMTLMSAEKSGFSDGNGKRAAASSAPGHGAREVMSAKS